MPLRTLIRLGLCCITAVTASSCTDGGVADDADAATEQPTTATRTPSNAPPTTTAGLPPEPAPSRDALAGMLERDLAEWSERHAVVGAAALVADGDQRVRASTGVQSVDRRDPITVHDQFAIGSLTKTVTAVAVVRLADAGLLSVDDAVADYIEGVPPEITIRDLLGHVSGYHDVDDVPIVAMVLQPELRTPKSERIADIVARGPSAARGVRHSYANANYLLLDEVIAEATGSTYEEQIASLVTEPLGMSSSGFEPTDVDRAAPHAPPAPDVPPLDLTVFDTAAIDRSNGAAGGLFSTLADLDVFIRAVFDGGELGDTVGRLTNPIVPGADYGLGLSIDESADGGIVYGHDGRAIGYAASFRHDPERDRTVIVLSNDSHAPTAELAASLLGSDPRSDTARRTVVRRGDRASAGQPCRCGSAPRTGTSRPGSRSRTYARPG